MRWLLYKPYVLGVFVTSLIFFITRSVTRQTVFEHRFDMAFAKYEIEKFNGQSSLVLAS